MDTFYLKSHAECLEHLTKLAISFELHTHDPVFNMKEMAEKVNLKHQTALVKNLVYVDKKVFHYSYKTGFLGFFLLDSGSC
jgi:hypothetical protein